jgi:hypothetical protein
VESGESGERRLEAGGEKPVWLKGDERVGEIILVQAENMVTEAFGDGRISSRKLRQIGENELALGEWVELVFTGADGAAETFQLDLHEREPLINALAELRKLARRMNQGQRDAKSPLLQASYATRWGLRLELHAGEGNAPASLQIGQHTVITAPHDISLRPLVRALSDYPDRRDFERLEL